MTKFIFASMAALFLVAVATPVASIATSTEASAWPKSKKCTDWCTNRSTGAKFRIRH